MCIAKCVRYQCVIYVWNVKNKTRKLFRKSQSPIRFSASSSKPVHFCSFSCRATFRKWVGHSSYVQIFWIMLKWANKYLGIQRLQSRSVYGDSNSFSMVVLGKKMNCQKVAPFLWNLPTFKKRTHQFWDSKVSGAFPGGLWAKVLLSKCLLQ